MEKAIKQLVFKISNNSKVSQSIIKTITEKLNEKEKKEFLTWLKIIRNKQQNKVNYLRNGYRVFK